MNRSEFYKQPTVLGTLVGDKIVLPLTAVPQTIGKYNIECLLHRGGMSLVYLGVDPTTDKPAVIKVVPSQTVQDPRSVERFSQEARLLEATNHPNIVKLYSHGVFDQGLYIAMEYVQGITLRALIIQQVFSHQALVNLVLQIATALAHLHTHGIVHGDVKPDNILWSEEGGGKLIDFGIAHYVGEKTAIAGTPLYMSPEQKLGKPLSCASDVYALGMMSIQLFTGRYEIDLTLLPEKLEKILKQAIHTDPARRITMAHLIHCLQEYQSTMSEEKTVVKAWSHPQPQWNRVEVGFASKNEKGLMIDTFEMDQGHVIIMAESLAKQAAADQDITLLKGMIAALKLEQYPPKLFIQRLNQAIYQERFEHPVTFAYLCLYPKKDKVTFISCGYSPLWHTAVGAQPRQLTTENVVLGLTEDMVVTEVEANWFVGDFLLLSTFEVQQHVTKEDLSQAIELHLYKHGDVQAQALLQELKISSHQRALAMMGIQRKE